MANQRNIKNRIKSISNTKKITSTMEMVSSAKMKKIHKRMGMSKNYEEKLNEVMQNVLNSEIFEIYDPLFSEFIHPSRVLVLQITGNRGLCGSFNTNVIYNSFSMNEKFTDEGKEIFNYVVGKKGIKYLKFINEPIYKSLLNPEDKLTMEDARKISKELRDLFTSSEFHEIYISYTKVVSISSQKPSIIKILPLVPEGGFKKEQVYGSKKHYIFEPNPMEMLSHILPLYLDVKIYNCFIESAYSEHFARRVAMKNATDASTEIVKDLNITYNRVRQAKITSEIADIVGGAAALD